MGVWCRYATFDQWRQMTGMGRTASYEALVRGDLRAKKVGRRVLIDVEHGLQWIEAQPSVKLNFRARRAPSQLTA